MNQDIKSLLINTCGTISYLVVIFFFITLILFSLNDTEDALKEAWNSSIAFSSVLATLGAAIIASKLFNHWRIQEDFNRKKNLHDEAVSVIINVVKLLGEIRVRIKTLQDINIMQQTSKEEESQLLLEFNQHLKNTVIAIQHQTHDISVKISMDYSGSINSNDPKLNFIFGTILKINVFVKNIAHSHGINRNNLNYVINFIDQLNIDLDKHIDQATQEYNPTIT